MVLTGCNATKVPANYLPNPGQVKRSIAGSWVEVTFHPDSNYYQKNVLSGELIAVQNDTLLIMSETNLSAVKINNINNAILYIFKNQGGRFALLTGLLIVPDVIGAIAYSMPDFLRLAIPVLITGTVITTIEGMSRSNRLFYPGVNSIEDFRKFARFPAGILPGVNRNELRLVKKVSIR